MNSITSALSSLKGDSTVSEDAGIEPTIVATFGFDSQTL